MSPQVSFLWGVLKIPSKCKLTFSSPPQKHLEKCGLHFGYVPPLKTVGDVIFAGDIPAIFASSQFLNLVPATTGRFRSWRRKHYATGRIHGEELFEGTETAAGKARKVSNPELDEYSPAFLLGDGFCQDYCNKPIIFEGFLFISKQPFFPRKTWNLRTRRGDKFHFVDTHASWKLVENGGSQPTTHDNPSERLASQRCQSGMHNYLNCPSRQLPDLEPMFRPILSFWFDIFIHVITRLKLNMNPYVPEYVFLLSGFQSQSPQ